MIKLERERTASAITVALRGQARITKALQLLHSYQNNTFTFNSKYWKNAKRQLKRESGGKCAYCEAPTDTVAHGDVEHFRPKSVYWWLTYCYDNYVFSCQICNQTYKGNHFPVAGPPMQIAPPLPIPLPTTAEELHALAARLAPDPLNDAEGYPMQKFLRAATREKAALPDPYIIDPEPFFKWVADPVLKEVAVQPRNNRQHIRRVFDACDSYLGLNRVELLRVRWLTYEYLAVLHETLDYEELPAALRRRICRQITQMMANDAPFAGMVRYFVRDMWKLALE